MSFIVVYDACVLYPVAIRDLLMRLATTGLFQARWTERILDECFTNLVKNRPELKGRLQRTRELMNRALPDAPIHGYESLSENLDLPDKKDCHVLAAAIRAGAQVIVTTNLRHFPDDTLAEYDIQAQDPDTFISHLLSLNPNAVVQTIVLLAASLKKPPHSPLELVDLLERRGLIHSAKELRERLSSAPLESI